MLPTAIRPCALLLLAAGVAGGAHAKESLLDIYLLALQNDTELLAAEADFKAALQTVPQAEADWLPHITFDYSLSKFDQRLEGQRTGGRNSSDRYTRRDDRLTLRQTLYHHDLYVSLQRADAIVERELARRDAAQQELIVRTAQAYFDVLAAQDGAAFARQEKDAIKLQLEQADARFQVGLTSLVEVKEAQASYDLATAREIENLNALETKLELLSVITGQPHRILAVLSDRVRPMRPTPDDIQQWTEAALQHNLHYLLQKHALQVARHAVRFEQAKHWPTLDMSLSLATSEDTGGVFSGGTKSRVESDSIGLHLNVPLLTGGKTYYRVEQAQFEYEAQQARLRKAQRETEQMARSAFRDVVADGSRIQAFARAVESARIDLEANEAGLEAGTRDTVDVIQATSRLYSAERDYSQVRYDYLVNTLRLRHASGQLAREDIERINRLLD